MWHGEMEAMAWVKAGPWWCASVSVKVSEVGAAACDDGLA